ncbi:MAG: hypothetical protein U0361_07260 [Nitrospiraceae bacterium]
MLIVTDGEGLVKMAKEKEYRSLVSKQLRVVFAAERFVKSS